MHLEVQDLVANGIETMARFRFTARGRAADRVICDNEIQLGARHLESSPIVSEDWTFLAVCDHTYRVTMHHLRQSFKKDSSSGQDIVMSFLELQN